jgi:hypothetical protein
VTREEAKDYITSLTADPHPNTNYRVCRSPADVENMLAPAHASRHSDGSFLIAEDTESLPTGEPYCLTFSTHPGTSGLIYVSDEKTLNYYRYCLSNIDYHHLFHNWLHDTEVFSKLDLPSEPFTDTMVLAYILCLGGGGDDESESRAGRGSLSLKILAYRHCNMLMRSFKDVVYPASFPELIHWLEVVSGTFAPQTKPKTCVCGHPTINHEQRGKTLRHSGQCSLCDCKRHKSAKPVTTPEERRYGFLHRKSANLIDAIRKQEPPSPYDPVEEQQPDEAPYELLDPWKRIRQWHQYDLDAINQFGIGHPPQPSIANLSEPELLNYACRDADATLRLYLVLRKLQPWIFWD